MPVLPRTTPPRSVLQSLERDINDTIRRFLEDEDGMTRTWSPEMDIRETDTDYRIDMDLPGVSTEDVTIDANDHRLTVHGERSSGRMADDGTVARREHARGPFFRRVSLPSAANVDDASAEFENGILTIRVPKTDSRSSRDIPIS